MHSDIIRLLTVAIAVSIPQDEVAFEMLQWDYINGFQKYYKEKCESWRKQGIQDNPIYLDEAINYAVYQLPIQVESCRSLTELHSEAKKTEIKHRFISESIPQMLSSLAKRDTIKANVRKQLHIKDQSRCYAAIESTKFDKIFTDFMLMFERSCAASFRFEGEFVAYVIYSFIRYYYASNKKDIWRILRSTDPAKNELENNTAEIRYIEEHKKGNEDIHELLCNIVALNDFMFSHSGQSDDARGVCYDSYYLVLNHLCSLKVKELNGKLTDFQIVLIDEQDRKVARGDLTANKSIASKISNAKELLVYMFESIRSGNWSLDTLPELRYQCSSKGKRDQEGRNCIWKNISDGVDTCFFFDMKGCADNYRALDLLIKGVMSVYSLMRIIQDRGGSLVKTYPLLIRVLRDKKLSRNIYTLYDLEYLDHMQKLQEMEADESINHGELTNFEGMVYNYAGSPLNNDRDIVANRQYAQLKGFMDNPRVKQKGKMQTPFLQLKSVANFMTALPRAYEEYARNLQFMRVLPERFSAPVQLEPKNIFSNKYSNFRYNKFIANNREVGDSYIGSITLEHQKPDLLDWHIGTGLTPYVHYQMQVRDGNAFRTDNYYCMYVAMTDTFLVCPLFNLQDKNVLLPVRSLDSLVSLIRESFYDGRYHSALSLGFDQSPKYILSTILAESENGIGSLDKALASSVGFDCFLGFANINHKYIQKALSKIPVYPKYKSSVDRYVKWMHELSLLQMSFIDVLQIMYSFSLYLAISEATMEPDIKGKGYTLLMSLLKSDFNEDNLNWFFSNLVNFMQSGIPKKLDFIWSSAPVREVGFTSADLSCLDIVFGNSVECEDDSVISDLVRALSPYKTIPQRFIQMYNFINIRLNFIRTLRDAYDLTFNTFYTDITCFMCELDTQFKISTTLEDTQRNPGTGGLLDINFAKIDTLSGSEISNFVREVRIMNWQSFTVLCEDLVKFFQNSRKDLAKLVDFDITKSTTVQSEFEEFGNLFYAIGPYTAPEVTHILDNIKPRMKKDSAGFILLKNSYLRGNLEGSEYYIHSTGRILELRNGTAQVKSFDFSHPADSIKYLEIVNNALRNNTW